MHAKKQIDMKPEKTDDNSWTTDQLLDLQLHETDPFSTGVSDSPCDCSTAFSGVSTWAQEQKGHLL